MFSVFPEILFLSPYSALLIRIALACVLFYAAWHHAKGGEPLLARALAVPEFAVAAAIALGLWTQPAALIGAAICCLWLARPSSRVVPLSTVLLSLVMALSLLVTGAGAYAFDLPF